MCLWGAIFDTVNPNGDITGPVKCFWGCLDWQLGALNSSVGSWTIFSWGLIILEHMLTLSAIPWLTSCSLPPSAFMMHYCRLLPSCLGNSGGWCPFWFRPDARYGLCSHPNGGVYVGGPSVAFRWNKGSCSVQLCWRQLCKLVRPGSNFQVPTEAYLPPVGLGAPQLPP